MRRFLAILLSVALVMSFVSSVAYGATCFVLSTWTETDGSGVLAVTDSSVTYTDMYRQHTARVYNDFGSGNVSADFHYQFEWEVTSSVASSEHGVMLISNTVGTEREAIFSPKFASLSVYMVNPSSPDEVRIALREVDSALNVYNSASYLVLTEGTNYYYTFIRDESVGSYGRLTLYQYSDSARTNLLGSIYIDLAEQQDFRYIHIITSYGNTGAYPTSGVIGTLCSYAMSPDIATHGSSDIEYNPYTASFYATLTGNVTDDGGGDVTGGFYYREQGAGSWSWAGALDTYNTGEQFEVELAGLDVSTVYEYYAYGYNEGGTDTGSTLNFTTTLSASAPDIDTLLYPITYGTGNVTVYGHVLYDGTANVTGWFQYRLTGSANWTDSSSNTTDLVTDDQFNYMITSVTQDVSYDFRAVASNVYGSTNGSIGTFINYEAVAPTMETLAVTSYTDTTAWLSGNVTDDGGAPVWASMQYRALGDSVWNETASTSVETGETFSFEVIGLEPSTTYQYRAYGFHGVGATFLEDYGDIMQFRAYEAVSVPLMTTGNQTWLNEVSSSVSGEVTHDGGSPVTVWFQYRVLGDDVWTSNYDFMRSDGIETGYEVSHVIVDLVDWKEYQYRVVGQNEQGTGYGQTMSFTQVDPDEEDDVPVRPERTWWGYFESILAQFNMDNQGGKLIIVILFMMILFGIFYKSVFFRVFMPVLWFAVAVVIGWVPIAIVIMLILGAGIGAWWLLRKVLGG